MKTFLVGECSERDTFRLIDPDAPTETEFEYTVVKALTCAYPNYHCFLFGGTFVHEGDDAGRRPDLALVAKDMSHWFVIEVELTAHSLEYHVLPQVRAFVYGKPQDDCVSILANRLNIPIANARTLIQFVPRSVAVIANRRNEKWSQALTGVNSQFLVVSEYQTANNGFAYEIEGDLRVVMESLGFGKYYAVDRSILFNSASVRLPRGEIQLVDEQGAAATWIVRENAGSLWVTKHVGTPDLRDGAYIQVVRTCDGRLLIKVPMS